MAERDFDRDFDAEERQSNYYQEPEERGGRKRKAPKSQRTQGADKKVAFGVLAILVAFIVFIVLVTMQKNIINSEATANVVYSIEAVPSGVLLDETAIAKYFAVKTVAASSIPASGYYTSLDQIKGKTLVSPLVQNQMLLDSAFSKTGTDTSDIEDPVELAIELNRLGQIVAGTLKPGDRIDIKLVYNLDVFSNTYGSTNNEDSYFLEDEEEEIETDEWEGMSDEERMNAQFDAVAGAIGNALSDVFGDEPVDAGATVYSPDGKYAIETIAENVLVTNVFNTAGDTTSVAATNGVNMVATMVTVVVPAEKQDRIQMALERGTVRLSRVLDTEGRAKKEAEEKAALEMSGSIALPDMEANITLE